MKFSSYWSWSVFICAIAVICITIVYIGMPKWRTTCILQSTESTINSSIKTSLIKYDGCDEYDPQITVKRLFQGYFKVLKDPAWIKRPSFYSVSYTELHSLLFGPDAKNIYETWPNFYEKRFDGSYPYTSLTYEIFISIIQHLRIPLHLIIEIGSFMGKSASNIGRAIQNDPRWTDSTILLCIDTWLGSLEHWTTMRDLAKIQFGRPTIFDQFIANIIAANLTNTVLPFSATSLIGAQFLLRQKLFPQIIYLDSAHLQGETLVELELYWVLLQPGGILIGDDWFWSSVRCDVLRFANGIGIEPTVLGNTWFIKKNVEFEDIE